MGPIIDIVVVLVGGIPYAIIGAGKPNAEPLLRNLGALLVLVAAIWTRRWGKGVGDDDHRVIALAQPVDQVEDAPRLREA